MAKTPSRPRRPRLPDDAPFAESAAQIPAAQIPAQQAGTFEGPPTEMTIEATGEAADFAAGISEAALAAATDIGTEARAAAQAAMQEATSTPPLPETPAVPISDGMKEATKDLAEAAPVLSEAGGSFADDVAALCEAGSAIAGGIDRANARLTDAARQALRQGFEWQRAWLASPADALTARGTGWIGDSIGSFAAIPGELALIALETAEAAARPVTARAQARAVGALPGFARRENGTALA